MGIRIRRRLFWMKIAFVSKTNGCVGGASFFAENLGGWLLAAGHGVTQFCVAPREQLQPYQRQFTVAGLANRVVRHANWRLRQWGMVEPFPWEYWFGLHDQLDQFDLIHFHDLYMAISPRTLERVARKKPVFFTAHDCSAFTGGCLYPMDCRRYREKCGACPQRAEIGAFDCTRSNLKRNRRLARSSAVHYVFPSKWIRDEAAHSLSYGGTATHIPNGFDNRAYAFQERGQARTILGLACDRKIVVVCSAALEDQRKGVALALKALAVNRDLKPFILVVGKATQALEQKLSGMDYLLAGFVTDRAKLGLFYAAADLLLFPSLGDNLPITIQESLAAATPVLAFAVGGVPELVQPGQTGWLVPVGNQEALNQKLREVLLSDDSATFGERGRALMHAEFSVDQCVHRHLGLYRTVLEAASFSQGKE